jgi:hypothetical protein
VKWIQRLLCMMRGSHGPRRYVFAPGPWPALFSGRRRGMRVYCVLCEKLLEEREWVVLG